jgi:signal transduction histidine kinase
MRSLFTRRLTRGQLIAFDCLAAWWIWLAYLNSAANSDVPAWVRFVLPMGIGLPLAARRLWPKTVFAVVSGLMVVAMAFDVVSGTYLAAAYALYLVALTAKPAGRTLTALIAGLTVVAMAGSVLGGVPAWWINTFSEAVFAVVALGGAWTVGRAVSERRVYAARLVSESVIEERLRIARDLHDVVAHSMGLIAIKAGVANHVLRTRPEEAHDALRIIETESRGALAEMRDLLGVLRTDPAELGPVPGVDRLAGLVERAGIAVDLDVRGADELPSGVGLSVYRIVQEALTNVVKHAGPARCRVRVEADGGKVRIEVTDNGAGRGHHSDGHGLLGMRERVAMYGGVFDAGPGPTGTGFRVFACLPYREAS